MIPLELIVAASPTDAAIQKNYGSGTTALVISNEEKQWKWLNHLKYQDY